MCEEESFLIEKKYQYLRLVSCLVAHLKPNVCEVGIRLCQPWLTVGAVLFGDVATQRRI